MFTMVAGVAPETELTVLLCHAEDGVLRYSTRYAVSGAPFVLDGAVHDTVAVVPTDETNTFRGAVGMPVRVRALALVEASELPKLLRAVTR
jgi:hypothetical protein